MSLINLPTQVKVSHVTIKVTCDYVRSGKFVPGYHVYGDTVALGDEAKLREVLRLANGWVQKESERDDRRNVVTTVQFISVQVPIEEVLSVGGDSTITWTA
jgi:hypothetical protein